MSQVLSLSLSLIVFRSSTMERLISDAFRRFWFSVFSRQFGIGVGASSEIAELSKIQLRRTKKEYGLPPNDIFQDIYERFRIKTSKFVTKICCIFEAGEVLVRRCGLSVSSPVQCFSPGWHFEKALFVVSRLDSKGTNNVNLIDLVKSFPTIPIPTNI